MKTLRFLQIRSCVCSREWNPGLCVSVVRVIPAGSCPCGISTVTSSASSVTQSCPTLCNAVNWSIPGLPCPSTTPGACSNSCPSHQWCHPTISSSVVPFSSCPQSFPASGSFPRSQFFTSGGQSVGVSASATVLPMTIQDLFPLGLTGCSPCSPRDSQESSPTPQFKSINSSALSHLHSPTLTSIHDHWKNYSLD